MVTHTKLVRYSEGDNLEEALGEVRERVARVADVLFVLSEDLHAARLSILARYVAACAITVDVAGYKLKTQTQQSRTRP